MDSKSLGHYYKTFKVTAQECTIKHFDSRNYFNNYIIQGTLSEGEGTVQFTSSLRQFVL
jgi:hypothetical protein